jgi:hypothetical protein
MRYGNFEYRVVSTPSEGLYILKLFEFDGIYYFISKHPSTPRGNNTETLREEVTKFLEALEKPVLMVGSILEMEKMPPISREIIKKDSFF